MYFGTIFFIDGFNRKTTRTYGIIAIDFPTAQAALVSLATATAAMSKCGITKTRVWEDTDFTTVIVPGANLDAGLTMTWELSPLGSEKLAPTKIPGPLGGLFDENGNLILTDVDVLAYEVLLTNGAYTISDGELPVDLRRGKLDR